MKLLQCERDAAGSGLILIHPLVSRRIIFTIRRRSRLRLLFGFLLFYRRDDSLPVSVRLPGRGDDVGHLGAVHQGGPGEGEFPVAVVDVIHDLVQAVEPVFLIAEKLRLALFRSRVECSHLYLKNTFAAPVLMHDPVA